jgi:CcmD family protein
MFEFLNQNQLYIVLVVTLLIWTGIVWYLLRLDKKIRHLEQQMKKGQ